MLDLGLPDGDGITLIKDVRAWSPVPIIVLSAQTEKGDKIAALDAGADDSLSKPFGVGELLARVRATLRGRRTRGDGDGEQGDNAVEGVFRFGQIEVDQQARLVRRAGAEIHLTPTEYRLLGVLLANAGRVTQRQLLREVWGPLRNEPSHYLRIYIGHLRQKLGRSRAATASAHRDRRGLSPGNLNAGRRERLEAPQGPRHGLLPSTTDSPRMARRPPAAQTAAWPAAGEEGSLPPRSRARVSTYLVGIATS